MTHCLLGVFGVTTREEKLFYSSESSEITTSSIPVKTIIFLV